MFQKQTIDLIFKRTDENTIKALKRGYKYKLYKFRMLIHIHPTIEDENRMKYKLLDEFQDLEMNEIYLFGEINKSINALTKKAMFKTKQDLFKVLATDEFLLTPSGPYEPYEYLSNILCHSFEDLS